MGIPNPVKHLEILLLEDNEGDVKMTKRALRGANPPCNISVANDGAQAVEFLLKQGRHTDAPTPHIILLDLNMPMMDGREFLDVVKADPRLRIIPVIMLTSSQSPNDVRDCYERYASSYVVKPFGGKEFMDTLGQVVNYWGGLVRYT